MPKGFNLKCAAGKTARVWLQGKGGGLRPGEAVVLLCVKEGRRATRQPRTETAPALIDENAGHVNIVVYEEDYRALKRGIENLPPAPQ